LRKEQKRQAPINAVISMGRRSTKLEPARH
jgi:hypothetical protein